MKFAFCFLTYKNIIHTSQWEPYFKANNIYIHPKDPTSIKTEYRSFIIPTIINTSWGDRSIVEATILLLEQAIIDSENEWFILCSEDSCPLKPYQDFLSYFEKQTMSILNVMDGTKNKTSQWWALSRNDVELLLKNKSKFNKIFEHISKNYKNKAAVDELFFLTALKQFKRDYTFKNGCIHYVKWFSEWTSKHPTTFNRLLQEDTESINNNSCWFIRKTFPTFQNKLIEKKSVCIIMCIGSESRGNYSDFLDYFTGKANIFLLVMDPTKLVSQTQLKDTCEQAFYVVWNMVDKAMEVLYNKFDLMYADVFILKENFNYTGIVYPSEQTQTLEFLKTNENIYIPISSDIDVVSPKKTLEILPPPKAHLSEISVDDYTSKSSTTNPYESRTNGYESRPKFYKTRNNSYESSRRRGGYKNKTKKHKLLNNKKIKKNMKNKLTKTRRDTSKRKN
jgi:hypothetical protein